MKSKHYICSGECNGVSEEFKSCCDESCSRFGKPLEECNCKDNKHNSKEK